MNNKPLDIDYIEDKDPTLEFGQCHEEGFGDAKSRSTSQGRLAAKGQIPRSQNRSGERVRSQPCSADNYNQKKA